MFLCVCVCVCVQLKTHAVSAKTMTMVEPVHLLLFGSSSVVSHGNGVIKLDEWYVKIRQFYEY